MRIKLDENMPTGLVLALTSLGHDVDTVPQENLTGQPDSAIWAAAQSEGRVLVTQDLDFSDVRKYKPPHRSEPSAARFAVAVRV